MRDGTQVRLIKDLNHELRRGGANLARFFPSVATVRCMKTCCECSILTLSEGKTLIDHILIDFGDELI